MIIISIFFNSISNHLYMYVSRIRKLPNELVFPPDNVPPYHSKHHDAGWQCNIFPREWHMIRPHDAFQNVFVVIFAKMPGWAIFNVMYLATVSLWPSLYVSWLRRKNQLSCLFRKYSPATWEGKEEIFKFLGVFGENYQTTLWENTDQFALGDTVAVFGKMNGITTHSGKEIGQFTFALRDKVRDGKVVLWNWFEDSYAVSKAYHAK